jgi:hypothetical protein
MLENVKKESSGYVMLRLVYFCVCESVRNETELLQFIANQTNFHRGDALRASPGSVMDFESKGKFAAFLIGSLCTGIVLVVNYQNMSVNSTDVLAASVAESTCPGTLFDSRKQSPMR